MFTNVYALLRSLKACNDGVASFEYGVLAAVVVAGVAAVGTAFSSVLAAAFNSISLTAPN